MSGPWPGSGWVGRRWRGPATTAGSRSPATASWRPPCRAGSASAPSPRKRSWSPEKRVASKNARLQACRHGHAEVAAVGDKALLPCTAADQRLLHGTPAQSGDDGLDAAARPGAVVAGADVKAVGRSEEHKFELQTQMCSSYAV